MGTSRKNQPHRAKPTTTKLDKRRHNKHRDSNNNTRPGSKYHRYRWRVGRPLGRGVAGSKAGRNRASR